MGAIVERYFKPWVGDLYHSLDSKLMIIGESRYDKKYTDHDIIESIVNGRRSRTHTCFYRALRGYGDENSSLELRDFWRGVIFYNYNIRFFPGRARVPLDWRTRACPENQGALRYMLETHKPTHCIAWGSSNWKSLGIEGHEFTEVQPMPGPIENWGHCTVDIGGQLVFFTFTRHPSWGFSPAAWHEPLRRFLKLGVDLDR